MTDRYHLVEEVNCNCIGVRRRVVLLWLETPTMMRIVLQARAVQVTHIHVRSHLGIEPYNLEIRREQRPVTTVEARWGRDYPEKLSPNTSPRCNESYDFLTWTLPLRITVWRLWRSNSRHTLLGTWRHSTGARAKHALSRLQNDHRP